MFSGYHVTRRTRKDTNGKAVKFDASVTPLEGASGVKKSGKDEVVDLYVRPIELPESIDDVRAMLEDEKWTKPLEKTSYGFYTDIVARQDGDEHKADVAPIVALLVNAIKLATNAKTNAEVAPKGMLKANRSKAELHWVTNDAAGYVKMIQQCAGDDKAKNKALDEYFAENLAE